MSKQWGENKKNIFEKRRLKKGAFIAFLSVFLILFLSLAVPVKVVATENVVEDTKPTDPTNSRKSNLTGSEAERTNITDPGSAESPDDLKKLNIANTVTVTYDNGNGSLMRILPLAFTNCSDVETRIVSSITHGHWISTEACSIYVKIIRRCLQGVGGT